MASERATKDIGCIQTAKIYEFLGYRFHTSPRRLLRNGRVIKLPNRVLQLLQLLLENHGRLVTHKEVREALWGGRTVEFDNSIHVYVSRIRTTINDDASDPVFLQTIPRQGYRIIADVGVRDAYPQDPPPSESRDTSWRDTRWKLTGLSLKASAVIVAIHLVIGLGVYESSRESNLDRYLDRVEQQSVSPRTLSEKGNGVPIDFGIPSSQSSDFNDNIESARNYIAAGEFSKAQRHLSIAASVSPGKPDIYVMQGDIALKNRWAYEDALRNYQIALEIDPKHSNAHVGVASYYALNLRWDESLKHLVLALRSNPQSDLIRAELAWVLYNVGMYDGASEICEEDLTAAPSDILLKYCLIRSYSAAGKHFRARKQVESFMSSYGAQPAEMESVLHGTDSHYLELFECWRLKVKRESSSSQSSLFSALSLAAASCGEDQLAIDYAQKAVLIRDPAIPFVLIDSAFSHLHANPDVEDMLILTGQIKIREPQKNRMIGSETPITGTDSEI